MSLVNRIIQKLGKANYAVDPRISRWEMTLLILRRGLSFIRGFRVRWRLERCDGILFLGRHVSIKSPGRLRLGKTVSIEDYVSINALSVFGVTIGSNVTIKSGTIIECTGVIRSLGEGLTIGNNVGISQNCFIQVRGSVSIGSNVMFGPYVSIFSENHSFEDPHRLLVEQSESRKGVIIEDDVWIGSGAKILDGVRIGKGSVIAAGSIVTRNIPEYSIAMGIPAKVIKNRKL
jgi:acetyltransferase-like isoleucine patch superfamily enzyme